MHPKKILILRFSAMGDVVLLVPVLRSFLATYPEIEVTVATRPKFASFFKELKGVNVFPADVDSTYKGLTGLYRLFKELHKQKFELVIDEHDHLRTKVLRTFFFLGGVPVQTFQKGRTEKKKITRSDNKIRTPLPHTVERYHQAFIQAGYKFTLTTGPHLQPSTENIKNIQEWLSVQHLSKKEKWIGIAPFAMHKSKIWPVENYQPLLYKLLLKNSYHFFLFGGGKKEVDFFNTLKEAFPHQVTVVAGVLKLDQELALMQQLDLMLCVDSSNMHLATLTGTPLLSIWGGTHPSVGFGPFQRDKESILQISEQELSCRPCSVYGKETCHRGDFACMTRITIPMVASRIEGALHRKS